APQRGPDIAALFHDAGVAARPAAPAVPPDAAPPATAAEQPPCSSDDDCGYDPAERQCGADPRYNKQPPLVDQGLVCYCGGDARAPVRVEPVPCEGEASCAVRLDPRPHPIRADAEHPYQKPHPCRPPKKGERGRTELVATCERTNICTMNRRECARP